MQCISVGTSRQNRTMASLERAIEIAVLSHASQKDKAGAPYILHPLRLMLQMHSNEERIVAVLHDVVEDTSVTFEDLEAEGFSEAVLAALRLLTHDTEVDYFDYVAEIGGNQLATRVKLADIEDNLDMNRIANPTHKDFARLEKYRAALEILNNTQT